MTKLKKQSDQPETNAETDDDFKLSEPNLNGDWMNVSLLLLLYVMQGLPLGISSAIPILIQSNKNVTYGDQAMLSFLEYPFSLKILWAPIVDALYIQKFGRRKSWLVPTQYVIGIVLTYVAWEIDNLLPANEKPNIVMLTFVFTSANFLAAVQDIAVDGWSLTMLKKNNLGYAAICNLAGQAIGILLGNMPLVLLTSEDFCNEYLRTTPITGKGGILTMNSIIYSLAILFIIITTLIAVFKKEKDCSLEDNHVKVNVLQTYSLLWYILKLPNIQIIAMILLTVSIGFVTTNVEIVNLKLIDAGISTELITIINNLSSIITIIMPIAIGKFISGPKSMNLFLQSAMFRLPMNVAFALLIYYTPSLLSKDNGTLQIPTYYYAILLVIYFIQNIMYIISDVPIMYFFSKISDARFGGTYLTLLNTLSNVGYKWISTCALALLDVLTFKICSHDSTNNCCTTDHMKTCDKDQANSIILVDGYYVETLLCTIVGIIWYFIFRKKVSILQATSASDWMVDVENVKTKNANSVHSTAESPL